MKYGTCPKKLEARSQTVIQAFRNLTGRESILHQYWGLAGQMFDSTGSLQPMCELNHVLQAGLLSDAQHFHTVECNETLHTRNKEAVARTNLRPHLYHGFIHEVLEEALIAGTLRPSLVNLDTLHEPRLAARLLGQVLHLLNYAPGPKVVVVNTIIETPRRGRKSSLDYLASALQADPFCQRQLSRGWLDSTLGYVYKGTGNTNTTMGTAIFYQPYMEAACSV